jgi:hypothetical protein
LTASTDDAVQKGSSSVSEQAGKYPPLFDDDIASIEEEIRLRRKEAMKGAGIMMDTCGGTGRSQPLQMERADMPAPGCAGSLCDQCRRK